MIEHLLKYEDQLIVEKYNFIAQKAEELIQTPPSDGQNTKDDINAVAVDVHKYLIENLIYSYLVSRNIDAVNEMMNIAFITSHKHHELITFYDYYQIPSLCEALHIAYLNSTFVCKKGRIKRVKSKSNLIETGAVYTQTSIAKEIVQNTLAKCKIDNNFSILDFACGTGRFYISIVEELKNNYSLSAEQVIKNNVFAVDIDPIAINITRLKALTYFDELSINQIQALSSNIILRDALVNEKIFANDLNGLEHDDFGGKAEGMFDAIVSNPPYLVLKPNKNKMNESKGTKIIKMASYFRNSSSYHYSIEGMLNLYQLSIERMITMLKENGMLGVICPSTLFADISATKLRKFILLNNNVLGIKNFEEKTQLFENVTQATNIFYLKKGGTTDKINISVDQDEFTVELSLVKQLFSKNLEIPRIAKQGWNVLKKLALFPPLRSLSNIRNKRGELDLTLYKHYITKNETPFRLIRGNMIGKNEINNINHEFVQEEFINTRSKDFTTNDFKKKRLICQQISNSGSNRRLKFVFCQNNDILGNSCNYISSDEITLRKLYLLLNSSLLNWRFKVTSSNNHINNYEIGELPIINLELVNAFFEYTNQDKLDAYIGKLYGLNTEEIKYIAQ